VFALFFVAAALRYDGFFSLGVAADLIDDGAVLGLAALGMTFVIASGGIDLSVGAVAALASVVLASAITEHGVPVPLAVLLAVALGTAFGATMGALIQSLELPAFIVTLGGMFFARGLALAVHVESLAITNSTWRALGDAGIGLGGRVDIDLVGCGFLSAVIVVAWILRHTRFGRNVLALGGDPRSALLLGVPIARTRVLVYAASGCASSLAGVAFGLYASKGDSTACTGLELEAIASAVIGGAALSGGTASAAGTLLGVLLFGTIQTILIFEGTPSAGWSHVVLGALLLAFLALQRAMQRRAVRA
jgi:simple sugar transport system permease protein